MAAFVERAIEARRGRKRVAVLLRVDAPIADRQGWPGWECRFRITVDRKPSHPPRYVAGVDSLQALLQAIRFAIFELERLEDNEGIRMDSGAWIGLLAHRLEIEMPGTRRRAAALRKLIRDYEAKYGKLKRVAARTSAAPRVRAARAKSAPRRARSRRRSAPRAW